MVFQHLNLFPQYDSARQPCRGPSSGVRGRPGGGHGPSEVLLGKVGSRDKIKAYPRHLLRGQQQRVAIARALCSQPSHALRRATSLLDLELVGDVLAVMKDLAASGMTMAVVTHEMGFARDVADRVVFFDLGVIVESGPPSQLISTRSTSATRVFLRAVRVPTVRRSRRAHRRRIRPYLPGARPCAGRVRASSVVLENADGSALPA